MQTYEELISYLDAKAGSSRHFPFGPDALVYKARDKIFAIMAWQSEPIRLSLKCEPMLAIALRQEYTSVIPGYHLNKKHWNTLICDGSIPDRVLYDLIDHSYELITKQRKA
jgi:predicted DNA-binding protein (MmcQ/YjbR family)